MNRSIQNESLHNGRMLKRHFAFSLFLDLIWKVLAEVLALCAVKNNMSSAPNCLIVDTI